MMSGRTKGLNSLTPGSLYQPSSVMLPRTLVEFVYPKGFLTRRVNNSGDINWHKDRVFISEAFRFDHLFAFCAGRPLSRALLMEWEWA
jgi:hypothetical protein